MGRHPSRHHPLPRAIRRGLILAALVAAAPAWSATYRWVDEKGGVHYGDSIPPQYAGQGHAELNAQGRVTKEVEPAARSEAERARREQEAARKLDEERAARDRMRRDNALMASYDNVAAIEKARTRALDQELSLVDSLQAMRKHSGSKAQTEQIDAMIRDRQAAIETIKTKYDADKARYLELTGSRR
jgi:predicted Zn-dependent peptidase